MHCKQWIFDMDGTLTDSMVVVWEGAPEALLARFGRTPKADLHETLLTMGMEDGAQYLIREYALPLDMDSYRDVMYEVSKADVQKIAETKMPDLNAANLESAMSMIAGTARSMGIVVED